MTDPQSILSRFENVTGGDNGQYEARCPVHDDQKNSLAIKVNGEKILLHCHANCELDDILLAAELTKADLFLTNGKAKKQFNIKAEYSYRDENCNELFQCVRLEPKDFRQRHKVDGKWVWSLKGVRRVLFRTEKLCKLPKPSPIIFVEGEKDVLAAEKLGFHATCNPMGAGKWISEHSQQLAGHNVAIIRDDDDPGREHGLHVAESLHGGAASVRVIDLDVPNKGDLSDWIDAGGTADQLVAIIRATPFFEPSEQPATSATTEDIGLVHSLASDIFTLKEHFAQDEAGNLYRFNDGVYKSKAAEFIKRTVRALCESRGATKSWTSKLGSEVVEYIRLQSPNLWEHPHDSIVNVKNGLLDIKTRKLVAHSPEHLSCVQIPVKFDPDATCPATDKFDSQVFPEDAVIISHEIAAVLICPSLRIQKAILKLGEGGNGKSRKLNQFKAFIGSSNCAAVSLHDLESNRFAAARLYGKLANICPDLPSAHLAGTSVFKAITGGDTLTAEFKFKTSFEFGCYARLIFSANHPPRSEDASEAFFDRWLVVPFQGRFRGTADEIPEAELDAMLTSPSELSGLLNHALDCMDRLRRTARYSEPNSVVEAHREFYATTDPFAVWLDQFTVDDPDAIVSVDRLRVAYGSECERRGMPRPSDRAFGLAFNKMRPKVERRQRTLNSRLQWCYVGIGLTSDLSGDSQHSQDSQLNPSLSKTRVEMNVGEDESGSKPEKLKEEISCESCESRESDSEDSPSLDAASGNGDCVHDWQDSHESDGLTRRFCKTCYRFAGFVLPDGSVSLELPTK